MTDVEGSVSAGFELVADAFTEAAADCGGSALSIRHRGRIVVDLWQGVIDDQGTSWRRDTPAVIFSCTKGLLTILIAMLVASDQLDLDLPVAHYWPEFASAGKSGVTVRAALSHRAGVPFLRNDIDLATALDGEAMSRLLAMEPPLWPPGTGHGYHALTWGWLAAEIVERVSGRTVGRLFQDDVGAPLAVEAWIGTPQLVQPRVARLCDGDLLRLPSTRPRKDPRPKGERMAERAMTLGRAFPAKLVSPGAGFDDPRVHAAGVPGVAGTASAHSLATIWSAMVVETDGVLLVRDDRVLDDMTRVQSEGPNVWSTPAPHPRWGTGFMLRSEHRAFLSPRSFGHDGAGGQVAFADRNHGIGFGYVTNVLLTPPDDRGNAVVRALSSCLRHV